METSPPRYHQLKWFLLAKDKPMQKICPWQSTPAAAGRVNTPPPPERRIWAGHQEYLLHVILKELNDVYMIAFKSTYKVPYEQVTCKTA